MSASPRLTAALAAVLLAAGGCEPPSTRDTLVIAMSSDVSALLPAVESGPDASINSLLYLSLNSARWREGAIEYLIDERSLAEGWEFDSDSSTLTYHLKPGARWSDGEPIDAGDVVFTYELIRQPEVASRYGFFWEELDSVVALDERRVTFHFRRRHPLMMLHSGVGIMPEHVYRLVSANYDALARQPGVAGPGELVVSGPFRVIDRRPGEGFELRPNPLSVAGPPRLDHVVFRIIPDAATRVIELENGGVDVIVPAPLEQAPRLARLPGLRVETTGYRYYEFIAWNGQQFDAFNDPVVRRALSLAIDRESILTGLSMDGFAAPAAGPSSPLFPQLVDPSLRPDPYRPDSAATLLAGAGWRDSDGDKVLDRDGTPFRITLLTQSDNELRRSIAEVVQAQLGAIGVQIDVRAMERNAAIDLVFNRHDFQAALFGWSVTLEPSYLIDQFWPPDKPYNITGYSSAALDSLVPAALAAADPQEAARYWRAVGVEIARDRPYAFLWFYSEAVALNDRVTGYYIDSYNVYQNLHQWTVQR
ncbi:MAG TPA: ABC transporter substrate-binding protein [Gemmatimonadota bacterium]|nr:ABC transporter substrate-binding protein [Gemmatimonadota bacterium]